MKRSDYNKTQSKAGFTLVELMIVISIMLILLTMTVMSVNYVQDSDRVTGAARQIQSFLSGARDRALYNKRPIGVRFFLDSDASVTTYADNPTATAERRTVSAMAYIDLGQIWDDGQIQLQRWDGPPPGTAVRPQDFDGRTNFPSAGVDINGDGIADDPGQIWMVAGLKVNKWWELKRRGLLVDGTRIRIPAGPQGTWYPVDTRFIDLTAVPTATQYLVLGIPYADPGETNVRQAAAFGAGGPDTYELELPPTIMPNAPSLLPDGVVIDLDGSRLPIAWRPTAQNGGNFNQFMDVVFSPKGNVTGAAAASGLIHLYVCDREEATELKNTFIDSLNVRTAPAQERVRDLIEFEQRVNGSFVCPGEPQRQATVFVPAAEISPPNIVLNWGSELADEEPYLPGERRLVSIFTQTGSVTVHPVDPTDTADVGDLNCNGVVTNEPDGLADDPFFFAETGAEAN